MGHPLEIVTFGVPERSSDGRLYTRYPQGNAPNSGATALGLGATASASAAQGGAQGGVAGENTPYDSPMIGLTIIRPRASGSSPVSSTASMPSTDPSFFAYPGVEYNVGAAAIGGAYPYTWSLSGQPEGMTINARTGEISWPNPNSNTGTITLTCTDSLGASQQTTFSVTVTTSGWFFVDQAYDGSNGSSNGTIDRPYTSINAMCAGANGNPNGRVYFRAGTYTFTSDSHGSGYDGLDGPSNDGDTGTDGGSLYLNIGTSQVPECWIGYPGDDIPVIDCEDRRFLRTTKPYFDRLRFENGREYMMKLSSAQRFAVIRRCQFDTVLGHSSSNRNQGFTFAVNDGNGYYLVIQDCTGANNTGANQFGSLYSCRYLLIERNDLGQGGFTGGHGFTSHIGLKQACVFSTIRHNVIRIPSGANVLEMYNQSGSDTEFCYNKVIRETSGTAVLWPEEPAVRQYVYRNTFVGNLDFDGDSSHDLLFDKNLVQGNYVDVGSVTFGDNIRVAFGGGLVDTDGNLTSGNSEYLGQYGAQIPE